MPRRPPRNPKHRNLDRPQSVAHTGRRRLAVIKGQDFGRWTDFYHAILTMPWPGFILALAVFFVALNGLFALIYMVDPSGIANARPGNFWDAFRFSVQTIASIGYGVLAPKSDYANIVAVAEAFTGILNLALITGAVFSRFSRPTARVLFSDVAVITDFDGVPTLMLRAANQRGNQILDATITVNFAYQQTTREGHTMRRFQELPLVRPRSPLFALSWMVMHRIDHASPLHGQTPESLAAMQAELICLLSGTDETLAAMIFARQSYPPQKILWRHRFADILSTNARGRRVVDLNRFHDAVPDEAAPE